ncbi:dethiobiotin synthase [Paracoccus pacificus]|uniref:ATP-dependent dethiobiotin synthetase BioD n=1 Tax=Paracoccus pacificus TaxID=1463598 RepID=A0ABW4RCB2_9RHOB
MKFVISGTGTDIGKTVLAAGLCRMLGADYWKPLQTGVLAATEDAPEDAPETAGGDAATVARLSGARIWPGAHVLPQPLSPHRAAELAGVDIDLPRLRAIPPSPRLIIEGAGGVLVPVTRQLLFADLFAQWGLPVVLAATTGLGTISHSLTAIEALRARGVPILGVAFIGAEDEDNVATIGQIGRVRVLGRLPRLAPLTPESLERAMTAHFDAGDFE